LGFLGISLTLSGIAPSSMVAAKQLQERRKDKSAIRRATKVSR
jgi:hypothetical protein